MPLRMQKDSRLATHMHGSNTIHIALYYDVMRLVADGQEAAGDEVQELCCEDEEEAEEGGMCEEEEPGWDLCETGLPPDEHGICWVDEEELPALELQGDSVVHTGADLRVLASPRTLMKSSTMHVGSMQYLACIWP